MKKLVFILVAAVGLLSMTSCNKEVVKTYQATMSQSGTNAPEADVFQNEIGDIAWEYVDTGLYRGYRAGGFPMGETFTLCNNGVDGAISGDLRHYTEDYIEFRTFAGTNELSGSPNHSNGCAGIDIQIQIREKKRP